jgi:hypothetical protein
MKKFSQFIQEANNSLSEFVDKNKNLAVFNAKRVRLPSGGRLIPNGHGDYHDSETGELIAQSETTTGGIVKLKFFNQNQRLGKRDPDQDRSKLSPLVPPSHQVSEEFEKQLRDKYIRGEIFNEGDWVENSNTGLVGKIIRRGTNYLICVTEDNIMFKPWIKDVVEWTNISGVPADQREVGTDALRKYVMSVSDTKSIDNFNVKKFINKYKAKRT